MTDKKYMFGEEVPHFDSELDLRIWMAGKNSEVAVKREAELARLTDENKRLREFVDKVAQAQYIKWHGVQSLDVLADEAAALLASLDADDTVPPVEEREK